MISNSLLAAVLSGQQDDASRRELQALDPAELQELCELVAAFGGLSELTEPVAPPSGLRARLMASLAGSGRYAALREPLCALFDLGPEQGDRILADAAAQEGWGPWFPGVQARPAAGGPATQGLNTGLVKVGPGVSFPRHEHHDPERFLILSGTCDDSSGRVFTAGNVVEHAAGTAHAFVVHADEPLVFAVVAGRVSFPEVGA